ncbi:hypothetical protein KXV27_006304, partial [Aspergillus fumigatus]
MATAELCALFQQICVERIPLDEDPGGLLVSRPDGPLQTAPPVLLLIVGVGPVGEQKPDELRIPVFPGREHDRRASVRVSGMDVHSTGPQQHPSDRVVIRIEPLTGNKQRGEIPRDPDHSTADGEDGLTGTVGRCKVRIRASSEQERGGLILTAPEGPVQRRACASTA